MTTSDHIVEQLRPGLPADLGHVDLTDQAWFARHPDGFPYGLFARLRREVPVLFHPPGQTADGEGFWVLTRHVDITAAAADPAVFSPRGGGGRTAGGAHLDDLPFGVLAGVILPMMDNPRHALLKQALRPAVTGAAAAALTDELRASAAEVVTAALERGSCDFAGDVAEPHAFRSIAVLLGVPPADRARLAASARESVGPTNRRTNQPDEAALQSWQATHAYLRDLVAARRADPGTDLTSALATATLPGGSGEPPLTDHERATNTLLLFATGGEQPRNTMAAGVLALARRPELWAQLRADRSLLPTAIEEMLRWAPPNPYNRRTATRDVHFGGVRIRAGEKVTLWYPSGNRDEAVFPEPERFDLRRSPNPHLTFGHGNNFCLGSEVAKLELRLLLEELLDRVAEIRVTGPITYQPSNKHTILLDMPVELVRG